MRAPKHDGRPLPDCSCQPFLSLGFPRNVMMHTGEPSRKIHVGPLRYSSWAAVAHGDHGQRTPAHRYPKLQHIGSRILNQRHPKDRPLRSAKARAGMSLVRSITNNLLLLSTSFGCHPSSAAGHHSPLPSQGQGTVKADMHLVGRPSQGYSLRLWQKKQNSVAKSRGAKAQS